MGRLVSKDGVVMVSTVDTVPATCGILEVVRHPDGTHGIEHDGNGSLMDWDNQKQVERNGQRVFMGEDDREYLEGDLIWEDKDVYDDGEIEEEG